MTLVLPFVLWSSLMERLNNERKRLTDTATDCSIARYFCLFTHRSVSSTNPCSAV